MSYTPTPRILGALPRRRPQEIGPHLLGPSPYAVVPLAGAPLAPAGLSESTKKMLMITLVVLGVLFLVWWFGQRGAPRANTGGGGGKLMTRGEALGRVSTSDLAKKLYERLDAKGASPATLRSLQRYAKK